MVDNTRDIVIKTATEVKQITERLARMHVQLAQIQSHIDERRGAERIAKFVIGFSSGGVAAVATKLFSMFSTMPK